MADDFNRTTNLVEIIKEATGQIGIAEPTTVIGSTERTTNSFLRLVNQTGRWLASKYEWQALQREQTINTIPGTLDYALPTDWSGYIADTAWNFSSRFPSVGSVPLPVWQMMRARTLAGITIALLYRTNNNNVSFIQVPSVAQVVKIWYNSRRWVVAANGTDYKDECTANDDVIRFEPFMFVSCLKWKWREARGFSTVAAKAEAMDAITAIQGRDTVPTTLSVVPSTNYPFIDSNNVPFTGYGQ